MTGPRVIGVDLKPCETDAAYQRHKAHGERPCPACNEAHKAYRRSRWVSTAKPKSNTTTQRFWSKVGFGEAEECWPWSAYVDANGYGKFSIKSRMDMAHRVAWRMLRGDIPPGLHLDHLCRNRACVNPWHLEPVTAKVNSDRGVTAQVNGERLRSMTHCKRGHEFNEINTRTTPSGARRCRPCGRDWARKKRATT